MDHDPGKWNKPEIREQFKWTDRNIGGHDFNLEKVDNVGTTYERYDYLRTDHGNCNTYNNDIRIYEEDVLVDDHMATFADRHINGQRTFENSQVKVVVRKTSEYR